MKQYETYQFEDFIRDEDFRDWVQGHSSHEAFWLTFPERFPEQRDAFRQAELFVRAASTRPDPLGEPEIRREVERFLEKAEAAFTQPAPGPPPAPVRRIGLLRHRALWQAAAAAVVVGLTVWQIGKQADSAPASVPNNPAGEELVRTTNSSQHSIRLVLSDGSTVVLQPKSQLQYPSRFTGNTRNVYLNGEALFSVKRGALPFRVHTEGMVTRVLGTRFVVRAFEADPKVTVQVLSGKVSVYKPRPVNTPENKEVNGLILSVNQAAIYEKSVGNLTKTLVATPALVAPKVIRPRFDYTEEPLSVILQELETAYAIPIQFDAQAFQACRITASLTHEGLYEKLNILCKAASASYEITDGQIVISRKGYK